MENASKALIIAGSILIALVVLSLGIVIFNNFKDGSEKNRSLTEQEIGDFNGQFFKYASEEKTVSGSQVNDLIQLVISVNIASKNAQRNINDRYVTIKFPSISGGTQTIKGDTTNGNDYNNTKLNKVKTSLKYKVLLKYSKGVVSEIEVSN